MTTPASHATGRQTVSHVQDRRSPDEPRAGIRKGQPQRPALELRPDAGAGPVGPARARFQRIGKALEKFPCDLVGVSPMPSA